ncbi:aminotransferase class III-fold pyridoxal phosphate-dependent enzyme [Mycolicibacterium austroafricanum]|jgi:4-aminobutyrate aminotransferase-like enzyme/Ser/Thr protein kinase RdoA (MazF antagonist)|uniref:Aminotransferase class III-fold pyridoxal phosphate-dependent enzyme n=1 Tax=Mycolicibacterium austroafricanum TaxID=39687 RepID=A0ABT8H7P1_MYCAO|nr:aminotransferase class III-fold pyridoxal phosphate-dependent enzyme [Mycolicibacterium austroafricanum]MDN4516560.1 aminotransferase class III-fold pyridoxal phosphate-dependent enzyme [Mycolicibacterium austroafricanum]QRZ07204.1 aminotransferase class III-fold pyridoxal phosphate-dependent enzyme [Mycolicibacterium austroafricanum]QZT68689.1 aminotransferase class III-fold pyridoxal phosphate-dependent enzyme [Mycolicibacterium austroafricanum]
MTGPRDLLADPVPPLSEDTIVVATAALFGFRGTVRRHFDSERDQTALLSDDSGTERVVKISHPATDTDAVDLEGRAAVWAHQADPGLPVAVPLRTVTGQLHGLSKGRHLRLYEKLPGEASRPAPALAPRAVKEYGSIAARLGLALRGFFHPAAQRRLIWHVEARREVRPMADAITDTECRTLVRATLERFERNVAPLWPGLRAQPVHSDLTLDNLLLDNDDHVCGIIDFGDLTHTALVADIAAALASVGGTRTGHDLLSTLALFLDGYTDVAPLEPVERALLADTVMLRNAIALILSAARSAHRPDISQYLQSRDAGAWNVLRELDAASPEDVADAFGAQRPRPSSSALLARRAAVFGTVLAPLTYGEPLEPICGAGATLFDVDGRSYIDAYNNVPVVGHAHSRVATAISDQARQLSTNLRYLHPRAIELAERLVASMPADSGLDTVLFLNSGSEATDLAWRIATAVTGHTGALVTEFAYHGVTTATTALSPEQWRGGWTPNHVERFHPAHAVGPAVERLAARGHRPAALFVDPTYTSDGILVPGRDCHRSLTAAARQAGAMVVADEVQAGFGRSGDHLWSFVGAGLHPDVVTLGKPMGNGHPVAAVLARRADVEALGAQTEFFSTYAGGPVAAAAASAVLDVIYDERLVEHAAAMGDLLRTRLSAGGHDVRGRGLLLGLDLGNTGVAAAVLDDARRNGVLIGTTGPRSDVLKIRPPLVITPEQVQQVASVVLAAIGTAEHLSEERVRTDA